MSQHDLPSPETEKHEVSTEPVRDWGNTPAPIWMQRMSLVILVVFCLYVGILVLVLPWTRYWNESPYMLSFSPFAQVMSSGFTRGVISGLGLLDIWIGISEILHYRERRV